MKHLLTDVNPETRDCVCSVCGPSSARKASGGKWICVTKQRQDAAKVVSKRGGVPGSRSHYHRISDADESSRTGNCSQCGPVDLYRDNQKWWRCGNKQRERMDTYLESNRESKTRWVESNPEKASVSRRRYKAKRKGWEAFDMSDEDRDQSLLYRKIIANDSCFYCGNDDPWTAFHVDHYVPLARGGTDHWWNLVQACDSCNMSKKDKDPVKFLQEVGKS